MAAIKDEKEDNKTGKMLALFDIMIHGHPLTKEQIATRFDVNARTANRYLAAIRQYLEEAEKEDGPRRELRYSREDRTYRIAEVENRFISKSELFAICKILLGGRTYSRKDLESLMNRLRLPRPVPRQTRHGPALGSRPGHQETSRHHLRLYENRKRPGHAPQSTAPRRRLLRILLLRHRPPIRRRP